jgi:hypothetical protein
MIGEHRRSIYDWRGCFGDHFDESSKGVGQGGLTKRGSKRWFRGRFGERFGMVEGDWR